MYECTSGKWSNLFAEGGRAILVAASILLELLQMRVHVVSWVRLSSLCVEAFAHLWSNRLERVKLRPCHPVLAISQPQQARYPVIDSSPMPKKRKKR